MVEIDLRKENKELRDKLEVQEDEFITVRRVNNGLVVLGKVFDDNGLSRFEQVIQEKDSNVHDGFMYNRTKENVEM